MADNKKKKTNFKDALMEARQLAAKHPDKYVIANINGEEALHARGSMDDEAWERTKQRAKGLSNKDDAEFAKNDRKNALLQLLDNDNYHVGEGSLIRDEDERELLRKMDRKSAGEFLEKRVQRQQWELEQSQKSRADKSEYGPGTLYKDEADLERMKSMPEERRRQENMKRQRDASERSEESASVGKGGSTPMARFAAMAQDAATGATPGAQLKDGTMDNYSGAAEQAGQVASAVGNVANKVGSGLADAGGELASAPGKVGAGLAKAGSELAAVPGKVMESPLGLAGQAVADTGMGMMGVSPATNVSIAPETIQRAKIAFGPGMSAEEIAAEEAKAKMDPGVEYDPATMPVEQHPSPVAPPPVAPPPPDPTQVAMSMARTMPGGFKVEKTDPEAIAAAKAAQENVRVNAENAKETVAALDIIQDGVLRKTQERALKTEEANAQNVRLAMEAKQFAVQESRRYETARAKVMEEARRAAAEPTDPNRFWNNKSEGQKAAAVIAGALFGFTGQGMQWLQRLDSLVEGDMRAQMADRTSKVQGLQAEAASLGEAGQRAMQEGATLAEAQLIEKQGRMEGLKTFLEMTAMQTQNLEVKRRSIEMLGQMDMKVAQLAQEGAQQAEIRAARMTENNYRNAVLGQEKVKTAISIGGAGAKGGGTKLEPGEKARLDQAKQGQEAVKVILERLGPESNLKDAAWDEITKHFGALSEAGTRQKGIEPIRRTLIRLIDASAIQKADAEYWKDKLSDVGFGNMSQEDMRGLYDFFSSQYNATLDTNARAGSNVSGFDPLPKWQQSTPGNVPANAPGNKGGVSFTPVRPTGF